MSDALSTAARKDARTRVGARKSLPARWWSGLRNFVRNKPLGAAGGLIVVLLIFTGIFADALAPYRYDEFDVRNRLKGMSAEHPFGTDEQGRDVFSRVIYGARTSVLIGFGAVAVGVAIASLIGIVSGYFGGAVDVLIQRIIDIWMSFPNLVFLIFVIAIFQRSTAVLVITLGLLVAAGSSRIVRSVVISIREAQYIEAARALGASHLRILLRHITPNVVPIIIVTASVHIGGVILTESSLSFLGFGPPPPFPSWGRMLQESQTQMTSHPNLAVFPGLAITLVVYAFNMLGDALRDVLDPRLRGSR